MYVWQKSPQWGDVQLKYVYMYVCKCILGDVEMVNKAAL